METKVNENSEVQEALILKNVRDLRAETKMQMARTQEMMMQNPMQEMKINELTKRIETMHKSNIYN